MRDVRRPPSRPSLPGRLVRERCLACGEVLAASEGCEEVPYPTAFVWGAEPWFGGELEPWFGGELEPLARCPDCGAFRGRAHHFDCVRAYCEACDDVLYLCEHGPVDVDDEDLGGGDG